MWNDLQVYTMDQDNLCRICNSRECDSVKTGKWEYDMFCAVCIEEQIKYDGLDHFMDPKNYPKGVDLQLLALGRLARVLTRKDSK